MVEQNDLKVLICVGGLFLLSINWLYENVSGVRIGVDKAMQKNKLTKNNSQSFGDL
jgi:hypothetical protein